MKKKTFSRRTLLKSGLVAGALGFFNRTIPVYGVSRRGIEVADHVESENRVEYELVIRKESLLLGAREGTAITLNDSFPGPLIRLKQGKEALIRVKNEMDVSTSVHWHGLILPNIMDGVPGVVFPGIAPGEYYTYRFPVVQSGTYWYHSHTGLQEQLGHYGPLLCDPAYSEPFEFDIEHVLILSDWTFEDPHEVLMHLKKWEGYYNYHKRTIFDLLRNIREDGLLRTLQTRAMWAKMRMSPRDIADVTGATYTYLINGRTPLENLPLRFDPGQRVRLRIINGSASTYFDLRIPGLCLKVVQADGQNVRPVEVDEIRIAVAETYDVIVEPRGEGPYPIFAEAMDRSGYALTSLTANPALKAPAPPLRPPPERGMEAMDMHKGMKNMHEMEDMNAVNNANASFPGCGDCAAHHESYPFGPDAAMIVKNPRCMLDKPGIGLLGSKRRVLTYSDLTGLEPVDARSPDRTLEIHLTGNMERFIWKMWAWDGRRWSSEFHDLLKCKRGERLKIVFVNHTMMEHPIHLHGMWMYLQNGKGCHSPRKHTINVKPAEKMCVYVDADAMGNWAFHCHILYHMHTGMFRIAQIC